MSELVTRAILKEELQTEIQKAIRPIGEALDRKLDKRDFELWTGALLARFDTFREQVREDMQSAVRMAMGDMQRQLGLSLEPTKDLPDRVKTLETLPDRVAKLEAKVFPPRRASRRR